MTPLFSSSGFRPGLRCLFIALFLFSCLLPMTGLAEEPGAEGHDEHGEQHTEEHGKHTLALFLGITVEHGENLETLGIEYSYRFSEHWSVGGVIERAEREDDSTLAIAFIHYWPYKGLYFGLGLGRKDPGHERENTVRGTIGYEFELPRGWGISPQANIDWLEDSDQEEVYGLVIGKRF